MRGSTSKAEWWLALLFCLACPIVFGFVALAFGQDTNWDLRNYHYYNPYALLNDRLELDAAPAQLQSFHNPTLHVPFYYAVTYWPARSVGFALGAIQALNCVLLFSLARLTLPVRPGTGRSLAAAAVAVTGFLGAGNLCELGTAMGDNIVSLAVLGALLLILSRADLDRPTPRRLLPRVILAGTLMGLAAGLKLVVAVYAVGLCAALLVVRLRWSARLGLAAAFVGGAALGFVVSGGYWFYLLWEHFENPLFPYFNDIFQSPMIGDSDWRDRRFLPADWVEALFFPFILTSKPQESAELIFRDLRIAILYLVLLVLAVRRAESLWPSARATGAPPAEPRPRSWAFLLTFAAVSYLLWLEGFGYYRYLISLELLAPLLIWIAFSHLAITRRAAAAISLATFVLIVATVDPLDHGRSDWGETYFSLDPPQIADPGRALVLMAGRSPTAYVVPLLEESLPFLRIQSNFLRPPGDDSGYSRLLRERIAGHTGELYVLYNEIEDEPVLAALHAYGLEFADDSCQILEPRIGAQVVDRMNLCSVETVGQSSR